MTIEFESASVACEQIVARAVDPDDLTKSAPRRVRKSAFIPRVNGKDDAGLSVTAVHANTLAMLRQVLQSPRKEAVTLHVGSIRAIAISDNHLDVITNPVDTDPNHALITGFPHRHPNESPEEKAIWNRLAELLAAHARCCLG